MDIGKRDPVTGRVTTGHEWNGIEELDTPIPRVVLFFLTVTILFAIGYWIAMPAWPLWSTYTKGLLGIDQREVVARQVEEARQQRSPWVDKIAAMDFTAIQADPDLMGRVQLTGRTLFEDNCAACHGTHGTGGPGFPDLADSDWLWGGTLADIAETIRVGINSTNPDSRVSQMMAFGRDGILERKVVTELADFVVALPTGKADLHSPGAEAFAENCASCHGEEGKGGLGTGAPALALDHRIYGGDHATVLASIWGGRHGVMPSWAGRLSEAEINLLAVFVHRLATDRRETVAR